MSKLQLFYPLSPPGVNQGWGVNGEYYRANNINILGHNGIDFRAYHGQPIYAAQQGTAFYEIDDNSGNGVVIVGDNPFEYKGGNCYFKTIYWHFCDPGKEPKYASPIFKALGGANGGKGVKVKVGDLLGYADSTGLSTGDHLHFGLKPIIPGNNWNPIDSADSYMGNWINLEASNGYLGAIDPSPYFNGYFAPQAYQVLSLFQQLLVLLRKFLAHA